jgi:dTDP-4-dehydrorhamnose reductase
MSTPRPSPSPPLEMWGGVECTVNRVGRRWFDQTARSGHHRRPNDLDLFAALGLKAIRYPALWERIAPVSLENPDWRWTDERLERLRSLGVRPILGLLHHGSGPAYTSLLDENFPELLARFARMVAERYPWVSDYTPVNEPLTTARFSAMYGHWYPHEQNTGAFVRALLLQARGTVRAMHAIRQVNPAARLVQTEDCGQTFGTKALQSQVTHEQHRKWLSWDLLTGRIAADHPMYKFLVRAGAAARDLEFFFEEPCPPDVVGLNYYLTSDRYLDENLERYPAWSHGGNRDKRYADIEAVRARPEGIVGHEGHLLAAWERYHLPVAITEVHLACSRDEQARWLVESWKGAQAARARGADVRAVTAWALLGSYDWDSLVTCEAGHYEPGIFDVRSPEPRPTFLASVVSDLASDRQPSHPLFDGPGWWHRPQRLLDARVKEAAEPSSRPLLIIGASGTLGRAFNRIAASRGLGAHLAGRPEVDITSPDSIEAVLWRVRPWAVINAAGYVRVDEAERHPDSCRNANVVGAVHLAAACRRHGISLITFSSDLVFDGTSQRPYTESDQPRPLSIYGCSKAEAESRVLEVLPQSLVVRTSAFFGPWDEYNFVTGALRAISAGEPFRAAADSVVSPTYVPDLVHASLDLLVDGETGIWHLANEGAVTWYEFARQAATLCGLPTDSIHPVDTAAVWTPARRPGYSALTSVRGRVMRPLADALAAYVTDTGEAAWRRGANTCASS